MSASITTAPATMRAMQLERPGQALRAVAKDSTVVCAGIHMSTIPAFPYDLLWGERRIVSVANLTRRDGDEFLALAPKVPVPHRGRPLCARGRQRRPRAPALRRATGGRGADALKSACQWHRTV